MARDGSGTYSLPSGNPVTTGTTISSTTHNNTMSDIASALTASVAKDGQTTMTANLPMGGFKLTNLAAGSASADSVRLGQLQADTGVYVSTVGGTADVITLTPSPAITAYAAGQRFSFIASGANTTNVTVNVSALGAKAVTKFGTTALVANNILSGALITITYDGTQFQLLNVSILPDSSTFTGSNTFSGFSIFSGVVAGKIPAPTNARISPSVAASALTIALKGNDGNDPSATNPVYVPFRNATATTGDTTWLSVTGALSTVISSGSTAGHASAQSHFLYVYALNNSSTVELAWSTALFDDGSIQSTSAEGGAGAADSATTLYSTSARSNVPIRLICRMLSNQTTAGTWAAAPTEVTPYPWSNKEFRSQVRLSTGNGHGSTNTRIRRFTTAVENVGSDITYADSAANGATLTINRDGIYAMSYSDLYSAGSVTFGISLNSTELTQDLIALTNADIVAITSAATNLTGTCAVTMRLRAGDVIRAHTNGTPDSAGTSSRFTISRVA